MSKEIIYTDDAPEAIGPYSQANKANGFIYCSGQIGLDPDSGKLAEGLEAQTRQVLTNLEAVLEQADASLSDVVKTTIFLKDINDYSKINEIYSEYFQDSQPARATVAVDKLPKDALIEIELIAQVD